MRCFPCFTIAPPQPPSHRWANCSGQPLIRGWDIHCKSSIKNTIQILQDNWLEQTRHLFLPIEFCFWMHRVEAESNKCKKEYFSVLKLKTKTEQCHKIFYPHFLLKRLKNLFRFWFDCKIQNSVFAQSLTTQTHEILAFHIKRLTFCLWFVGPPKYCTLIFLIVPLKSVSGRQITPSMSNCPCSHCQCLRSYCCVRIAINHADTVFVESMTTLTPCLHSQHHSFVCIVNTIALSA